VRLFLDSNVLTYIAFFEGYLIEGQRELPGDERFWTQHQGGPLGAQRRREVYALRALYVLDDQAHFDFLFSDIALNEIKAIRDVTRRRSHDGLLDRLIEHRADVYEDEQRTGIAADRETRFSAWQPQLPARMWNDARQLAEATVVGAHYFLTNDSDLITRAARLQLETMATRPSDLPFLRASLDEIARDGG
jgi:hypothetical protein